MAKKEPDKEIVVTAVRNNRKSIHLEWEQGTDEFAVTFHDNPRKSFYTALDNLVEHVLTLGEFPAGDAKKITATGITVRALGGDNAKALIVAQKKLKRNGRVLNIATPIIAMYAPKDKEDAADHMSDAEAAAIEKVIKEAKKYIAGDREQGQIEFDEPEKPGAKKDDATPEFPPMSEESTREG